jgi:hypothetical protein
MEHWKQNAKFTTVFMFFQLGAVFGEKNEVFAMR